MEEKKGPWQQTQQKPHQSCLVMTEIKPRRDPKSPNTGPGGIKGHGSRLRDFGTQKPQ